MSFCGRLKPRMGTCARGRFSVCAWPSWVSPGSASPIRAELTASVSSPTSKSIVAPRTPSRLSPAAVGQARTQIQRLGQDAATFVDLNSGRAVRIVALEDSRELARKLYPHEENQNRRQLRAYRELPDAQLFRDQWVVVAIDPADLPGHSASVSSVHAAAKE